VQNTIGIDIERNLDLRHATWRWRNPFKIELTQALVAGCNFTLTLEHFDRDRRLIVIGR
jgi:hypothetical protein